MWTHRASSRRVLVGLVAATLCLVAAEKAAALPPYVRIEEDWELLLNTPDISFPTPQIVINMKPAPTSSESALFLINHHDTPEFNVGGGQIQLWDLEVLRSYKSFTGPTLLNEGEHVTWTQFLQRDGAHIKFGLNAVDGDAWGSNTPETLGDPITWVDGNPEFWNYSSQESAENAAITFGPERIELLRIVQVRKFKKDGSFDVEGSRQVYPIQ